MLSKEIISGANVWFSFIEVIRPRLYVVKVNLLSLFCFEVKILKSDELNKFVDSFFVIVKPDDTLLKHWNILLGKTNLEIRSIVDFIELLNIAN